MARYLGVKPTEAKPFYFLSYNSEDQERVAKYAVALNQKGVPIWYDEGIKVGSDWESTIIEHINDSEAVVMFISKGIFQKLKSYVHKEFEIARDYFNKKIIIVFLDEISKRDVPIQYIGWWVDISRMQCINASDIYTSVEKISEALNIKTAARITASKTTEIRTYNNGIYEGEYVGGKRHGYGKYTWTSDAWAGDVYEGEWIDDFRTGNGRYTYKNGEKYEGRFVNGAFHGRGKFYFKNGDVYDGDWLCNERTGNGKYTGADGSSYEGDFLQGAAHGKGKRIWSNGTYYEGDFVKDQCTGKGRFSWPGGEVYEGDVLNGMLHGIGRCTWANGTSSYGRWQNGEFIG